MDKKTVSTIAYLSRLALNAENGEKITQDLENIIKFVDQLENANTQNIEPLANPLSAVPVNGTDLSFSKNIPSLSTKLSIATVSLQQGDERIDANRMVMNVVRVFILLYLFIFLVFVLQDKQSPYKC